MEPEDIFDFLIISNIPVKEIKAVSLRVIYQTLVILGIANLKI